MRFKLFPIAVLLLLAATGAAAQVTQVTGKVTLKQADGTIVPVKNAQIDLYRTDIKSEYHINTNAKGVYIHAGLPFVGTYHITVSAPGARPDYKTNVRISQQPANDFELQPGDGSRLSLAQIMAAQSATSSKTEDEPLYRRYRGVSIGMATSEAREKLGSPLDKGDMHDAYGFGESESATIAYDKDHRVMAISVTYIGKRSNVPSPKMIFGMDIEAKADGSMYQKIGYPRAGYWVSYTRTSGDAPMTIVAMQKIP